MALAMELWLTMFMVSMTWMGKMFRVTQTVRMNIGKIFMGKMEVL